MRRSTFDRHRTNRAGSDAVRRQHAMQFGCPVADIRRECGMATLIAHDIGVSFGREPVLDSVTLTVAPGHRIGVVGANGTGESTLLRVLAGDLVPNQGSR